MSLYTLKAKVTLRVDGISGPFEQVRAWHVNANNLSEAKTKFEEHISQSEKHVGYQNIKFEYLEIIGEIK